MGNIKCFLIEKTGEWTGFIDGVNSPIYRRVDTGQTGKIGSFGVGAIWDCEYYHDIPSLCGPDGKSYAVETPGGTWLIDSEASNCTRKGDITHKCWCRHGEAPNFTVDKIGNTCKAGAGSIMIGSYHGFLRGGYLVSC